MFLSKVSINSSTVSLLNRTNNISENYNSVREFTGSQNKCYYIKYTMKASLTQNPLCLFSTMFYAVLCVEMDIQVI